MDIEKEITRQLARCMALYGDQPEELMIKLESLVMHWYIRGRVNCSIESLQEFQRGEARKVVQEII